MCSCTYIMFILQWSVGCSVVCGCITGVFGAYVLRCLYMRSRNILLLYLVN